jgi:hypothetical protein
MRLRFVAMVAACAALGAPLIAQAQAKKPARPVIAIPFEAEKAGVRLNDDATTIPGHRIRGLPVVDGKMGEHVVLDGGVELYFPFGRVVAASREIHPGDASYGRHIGMFDSALGAACASEQAGAPIELRLKDSMITVVRQTAAGSADRPAFRVTSVVEPRWLDSDPAVQRLYTKCLASQPAVSTASATAPAAKPEAPAKKPVRASASPAPPKTKPAITAQQ